MSGPSANDVAHKGAFPLLLVVGSLLAISVLLSKIAAQLGAPMLTYLTLAMGISGLSLRALNGSATRGADAACPTTVYSLVAGGLMALACACGYLTVHKVGAAFIALAMAFPPLLTWVMSLAVAIERFDALRLIGLLVALAGGVMIAVGKGIDTGGDVSALVVACAMPVVLAVGNVYRSRYWPAGARPRDLAGAMLLSGAALTLPIAILVDGVAAIGAFGQIKMLFLLAAVVATFVAQYTAFFRLQQIAGPVYLSQVGSVAAVIGGPVAVGAFGEKLPAGFVGAATLIVFGLAIFQRRSRLSAH